VLATLAATLVPVVMIAVGLQLSLRLPARGGAPLALGSRASSWPPPALALLRCRLLGMDGEGGAGRRLRAPGMPARWSRAAALAITAGLAPSSRRR